MSIKSIKAGAAVIVASTALAAGLAAAPANAAVPGDVCNLLGPAAVNVPLGTSYWLAAGDGFRIVSYADGNRYYGHGNGKPDGYITRTAINQATCH